ncbi:MAG TPA: GNAT family N-acetyltransferase [Chloroflexota bacterium]|nr:GNAT family N-acetyltransferase [Chloroflexota bacterium]
MAVTVEPLTENDREWVRAFLWREAGNTRMVSRGRLHQCDELPGFIASLDGERVGLVTVRLDGRDCEVVTLHTAVQGRGLGSALLATAADYARQHGCHRAWLITTNDNEPAIRFYSNRGWRLTAVHKGALAQSRLIKPEIPLLGLNGIPIKDEIEFELVLAE